MTSALTSPGGWGSDAIKQAGWLVAPRRGPARFTGDTAERYLAASTRRPDNDEADTHVESHEDVLSDAGSTPAASTTLSVWNQAVTVPIPAASTMSPRVGAGLSPSSNRIAASTEAGDRCMYR